MTLSVEQKQSVQRLLAQEAHVINIINDIYESGGAVYLVGGCVRDIILGATPDDLDFEVHGLTLEKLAEIMHIYGHVIEAGKSFGVLRLEHSNAEWALPRTDSAGRKPEVRIDTTLSIEQALERRDVTINAMAIELRTYTLIDPFNGLEDLHKRILRSPNAHKFIEDPLRFYRVMQFIGRFDATVDAQLEAVCAIMDIKHIARERIEVEFEKLLLKSTNPSRALRWLAKIKRIHEVLPELSATQGIEQSPQWHPEGDVFEHTMQAVDAAAHIRYSSTSEKLALVYAALCHDLGKVTTTQNVAGRITSYGHELVGVDYAHALLRRITENADLLKKVTVLVRYHMMPGALVKQNASAAAYKRLAMRLHPITNMRELSMLAYADKRGRNGVEHAPVTGAIEDIDRFVAKAREYGVYEAPEEPVIQGRDLVDLYGSGPKIGELVRCAYQVQINRGITEKERLLRVIAQEAKKL